MVKAFLKRSSTFTVEGIEKCRAVLEVVRRKGPPLTVRQLNYCDEACIGRFLKAKGKDVKKAAKQLRATLCWRESLDVDNLTADEFPAEIAAGHAFVAGHDVEGRPVLITRMLPEHLASSQAQKQFFRYFVFTMEVGLAYMSSTVQQCILILDAGSLKKGAPGFSAMVQLLKLLGDHYPERVARTFVVDAPPMFYYLCKGIGGFLGVGMREKLKFVFSKDYKTKSAAAEHLARTARSYSNCNEWTAEQSYNDQEDEDKFDTTWSSKGHTNAVQSVSSCSSFRISSSSSCSSSSASSLSSCSSSLTGASLVLDKAQARSFSFATSSSSNEQKATSVEFRSFRADAKSTQSMEDGYSSRRWADLPFTSSSMASGSKVDEALHASQRFPTPYNNRMDDHQHQTHHKKEKNLDPFPPYYHNFFLPPYNEAAYRDKMKAPLGGLISIVSPDLKSRQGSFSLHGKTMEAMLHHLSLD